MALNCKKLIASYLDDILKIYDLAIEAGLKNPTDVIFDHFFDDDEIQIKKADSRTKRVCRTT